MTGFVAPLCGVGGAFKLSLETLRPILSFLPWKKTESTVYDIVQSDEGIILSETIFMYSQSDVYEVVLQKYTDGLLSLCGLYSVFVSA